MSYGAPCEWGIGAANTMPLQDTSILDLYMDLFLMLVRLSLPRRKLGRVVSAIGGSDVGRRQRRIRSGPSWIVIDAFV